MTKPQRVAALKDAEDLLAGGFPVFVSAFARNPPFDRPAQLSTHQKTIDIRRTLGSAQAAIHDATFLEALYKTLRAWGIGSRGSRLLELPEFARSLEQNEEEIAALESVCLDAENLNVPDVSARVGRVVRSLRLVDNKAALVPTTKALHHLLPDLVVPMDRVYTRLFFGWHELEFQRQQARCFEYAFGAFSRVARTTNPRQYVDKSWNTSLSKVIDNALVGVFVVSKRFRKG
jgi:hypothetical protein